MKEPIQTYCRLGIVQPMLWKDCVGGQGDYAPMQSLLDDPDFGAVEMTWIKDAATRADVAERIRASGKAVGFAAQPVLLTQGLDLNDPHEDGRRKAAQAVIAAIPQACELGARGFAVLSGPTVDDADKPAAIDRLVRSLVEIADALNTCGDIPLILETFDSLPYGKNRLIGSSADAARVARRVRESHPNFGVMLDLSHLPLQGETPRQAVAEVQEFLAQAHVGNCIMAKPDHPMNGDEHPPLADPDGKNGVEEVAQFLSALLEVGFLNKETPPILSFEVCIYKDWTREALVEQSKQVLTDAWARV